MANVDLSALSRLGSIAQIPVRRPTAVDGFAWEDSNAFSVKSQTSATFLSGPTRVKFVAVTIPDGQVVSSSQIQVSVQLGASRQSDEAQMDPVIATIGTITPGTSVVVTLTPSDLKSIPTGAYLVNYARV